MDVGFVKAESTNLPRINSTMIHAFFFGNPDYCSAEQRNVKTSISGRESYGDDAIGYVQLKREETICTIKCKICPEHKVRIKHYSVTVVVDEHEEKVEKAQCEDCPAAAGGCKHAVAFLMWLHRRSEEPATTSISCYWKKSNLSKVGSSIKILTCKEMNKRKYKDPMPDTSLLNKFYEECKKRNIENCQFYKHSEDYREKKLKLSMHQLIWEFNYLNYEDFLLKIKDYFTKENLDYAEKFTREQNQSSMWFELRYGRVTASKSYEVSRCKTAEGSLMATIFGARTLQTPAIKRGQKLEVKVREVVEEMLGVKFFKCGLHISDKYPMIAGSPDGINREKGVLEIKCPSTENNFKNYIKDGKLTPKCYAQVQMQMFCAKVTDSYFCVASSDFESSKNVTILPVSYDATYTNELIKQIVEFWEHNVFPKLKESVI